MVAKGLFWWMMPLLCTVRVDAQAQSCGAVLPDYVRQDNVFHTGDDILKATSLENAAVRCNQISNCIGFNGAAVLKKSTTDTSGGASPGNCLYTKVGYFGGIHVWSNGLKPYIPVTTPVYATGGAAHAGYLSPDGNLSLWGDNTHFQLGVQNIASAADPRVLKLNKKVMNFFVGGYHTGALTTGNELYLWGRNDFGQLGDGTTTSRPLSSTTPPFMPNTFFLSVALGELHSGIVTFDGDMFLWGKNVSGQLGWLTHDESTEWRYAVVPGQITSVATRWKTIALGGDHSGALTKDGELYMWGDNSHAQLGLWDIHSASEPVLVAVEGKTIKFLALGGYHSAVLTSDGDLYMWGSNAHGELGLGFVSEPLPSPSAISLLKLELVSLGYGHSSALTKDGKLYTWGDNTLSQIARPAGADVTTPQARDGVFNWISAGKDFTIATSWAPTSQAGQRSGNTVDIKPPVALKDAYDLWSWGHNDDFQLGLVLPGSLNGVHYGALNLYGNPQSNPYLKKWMAIAAGDAFSAGITFDGQLWTWGDITLGQRGFLNTVTTGLMSLFPTRPWGTNPLIRVDLGHRHTAVLSFRPDSNLGLSGGQLYTWGDNSRGQLGYPLWTGSAGGFCPEYSWCNPNQPNLPTLPDISPLATSLVSMMSLGGVHTAVVRPDKTLWTWGDNTFGQLGIGNPNAPLALSPLEVVAFGPAGQPNGGKLTWSLVACGMQHTGGLTEDGSLYMWGDNSRLQLAPANWWQPVAPPSVPPIQSYPILVGNPTSPAAKWKDLKLGKAHSAAINKLDGQLYTWGDNTHGQMGVVLVGNPNPIGSHQLVRLPTLPNRLSLGADHTAVTDGNLLVYMCGLNNMGQLGNFIQSGVEYQSLRTPLALNTVSGVRQVALGGAHTLILTFKTSTPTMTLTPSYTDSNTVTITPTPSCPLPELLNCCETQTRKIPQDCNTSNPIGEYWHYINLTERTFLEVTVTSDCSCTNISLHKVGDGKEGCFGGPCLKVYASYLPGNYEKGRYRKKITAAVGAGTYYIRTTGRKHSEFTLDVNCSRKPCEIEQEVKCNSIVTGDTCIGEQFLPVPCENNRTATGLMYAIDFPCKAIMKLAVVGEGDFKPIVGLYRIPAIGDCCNLTCYGLEECPKGKEDCHCTDCPLQQSDIVATMLPGHYIIFVYGPSASVGKFTLSIRCPHFCDTCICPPDPTDYYYRATTTDTSVTGFRLIEKGSLVPDGWVYAPIATCSQYLSECRALAEAKGAKTVLALADGYVYGSAYTGALGTGFGDEIPDGEVIVPGSWAPAAKGAITPSRPGSQGQVAEVQTQCAQTWPWIVALVCCLVMFTVAAVAAAWLWVQRSKWDEALFVPPAAHDAVPPSPSPSARVTGEEWVSPSRPIRDDAADGAPSVHRSPVSRRRHCTPTVSGPLESGSAH